LAAADSKRSIRSAWGANFAAASGSETVTLYVPDYGAVPVDVLVVGPPALPAVAASAIATPPNAIADKIDIVLVFQY
jgi:hypothetical protein